MNKKDYLDALDKVKCRDKFREDMENLLSQDSGEFSDKVNQVEIAHPHRFRRIFASVAACAAVVSIVGVSYKILDNAPDMIEETKSESDMIEETKSESKSNDIVLQDNCDLIEIDFGFENFFDTSFDFESFHITDDERRQIAELFKNNLVYKGFKSADDIPDSQRDMHPLCFQYSDDTESMSVKIFSNDRLLYEYSGENEMRMSSQINYETVSKEIYKILNITGVVWVQSYETDAIPINMRFNDTELDSKYWDILLERAISYAWAEAENAPDLSNASIVNEICMEFEHSATTIKEYDNGYIETFETIFSDGEERKHDIKFYRSRFFENIGEIFENDDNPEFDTPFGNISSYDLDVFSITDDERRQLAKLLRNYEYTETDPTKDTMEYNFAEKAIEFSSADGQSGIKISPDGRLYYSYKAYSIDYNYFRDEIYKILNIENFGNFVYALADLAEAPEKIELNGETIEISNLNCEWAVAKDTPDMKGAEVVNEMKVYFSNYVHIIREYDNGYIETSNEGWNENEIMYYRSRFFENLNLPVSNTTPFEDFLQTDYDFNIFSITDSEREQISNLIRNYNWVETDDDSWGILDSRDNDINYSFHMYDGEMNCFMEFYKKGFMVYHYQENAGDANYKDKAYKIDYEYFNDEINKILNISGVEYFGILNSAIDVSGISFNGNVLEGEERDALVEYLAVSENNFSKAVDVPDLSEANVMLEIEYNAHKLVKLIKYDNGYLSIDGEFYRTDFLDVTMDDILEFYNDYKNYPVDSSSYSKLMHHSNLSEFNMSQGQFEKMLRTAKERYNSGERYLIDVSYYAGNFDDLEDYCQKDFVYHMMTNSANYYNSAEGKINYSPMAGSSIEYSVDQNYSHWIYSQSNSAEGEYFIYDGNYYYIDLVNNTYSADDAEEPDRYTLVDNDRIITVDGQKKRVVNGNNFGYAGAISLCPEAIAFRYLDNQDLWQIMGTENYADRECVVIEGSADNSGDNEWMKDIVGGAFEDSYSNFKMYVDKYTGILLKYEFYGENGEVLNYMETEYINIDGQIEHKNFNSDGYKLN